MPFRIGAKSGIAKSMSGPAPAAAAAGALA